MLITLGWFIKNTIQRAYNRIDGTQKALQEHVQEDLVMQDRMIKSLDKVLNYLLTHNMVLEEDATNTSDQTKQPYV